MSMTLYCVLKLTAFESGYTEHLGAAITNFALVNVAFLCNLDVQCIFFIYLIDFMIKFIFSEIMYYLM